MRYVLASSRRSSARRCGATSASSGTSSAASPSRASACLTRSRGSLRSCAPARRRIARVARTWSTAASPSDGANPLTSMSEPDSDETRAVRAGEELDPVALDAFMRLAIGGEPDGPPLVRQFPGGFSNLTYALTWDERDFVLRRPPFGARGGSAHDMVREYRVLGALHTAGIRVPRPLALCEDPS